MIPILYSETETEFSSNGIGALSDVMSCAVTEERNGTYEAEMQYPISGQMFSEIKISRYFTAKPNASDADQPFEIYKISKPINGRITVYGRHLRYRMNLIPVSPFSAAYAGQALEGLKQNAVTDCPFNFSTDSGSNASFKTEQPYSAAELLGGVDGSILDTYGGEYYFDKWNVKLCVARGKDNGVLIRYGKNLTDLTQEESIENTITGIYPYWKNTDGAYVELPEKIVSSENAQYFPYPRVTPLDMSDKFQDQPTTEQLRDEAERYVKDNDIGVPAVSLKVSFVQLEQTEEYKDMKSIETVSLCDYVTVEFEKLGVSAKAKVIKTVYDSLKEKYDSIEVGDAKTNLAMTIIQQKVELEKRPTSSVVNQYIESATQQITGNKGGYIRFKLNDEGQPEEFLIMDTPDIETAKNVWRWNLSGLGHSSNGYDGPYPTAITQDGAIVADFITAGTMLADRIRAGKLLSMDYVEGESGTAFDLDTGEIISYFDQNGKKIKAVFSAAGIQIQDINNVNDCIDIRFTGRADAALGTIRVESDTFKRAVFIQSGRIEIDKLRDPSPDAPMVEQIFQWDESDGLRLGKDTKIYIGQTGRAEFSDGSYLEFLYGSVVGGRTASGTVFGGAIN